MQSSDHRIRKLRIRGDTDEIINAGLVALQDAFNMASFPGLPPGRLLLLRRMDLGKILQGVSSIALSKLIEDKIQTISAQMVCVDMEEHPDESIIWFSDKIQPVLSLIDVYLQNKQPSAWYWKVIFPSWKPGMGLAGACHMILAEVLEKDYKAMIGAQIIQKFLYRQRQREVFSVLTSELATRLLSDVGIFPHKAELLSINKETSVGRHPDIDKVWLNFLQAAVSHYGKQAPQTFWLTFNALVIHNPAVLSGEDNIGRISELIQSLIQVEKVKENRLESSVCFKNTEQSENSTEHKRVEKNKHKKNLNNKLRGKNRFLEEENKNNKVNKKWGVDTYSKKDTADNKASTSIFPCDKENLNNVAPYKDVNKVSTGEIKYKKLTLSNITIDGYQAVENAGLVFIVSLLEFISIRGVLRLNSDLVNLNFPARLIASVAQRFDVSPDHPLLLALPERPKPKSNILHKFVSPDNWRDFVECNHSKNKNLYCFYTSKKRKHCYITDKSKKILLYIGASDSSEFPSWIRGLNVVDKPGNYNAPCLTDLENTLQLLCFRYLYRYSKMGLRNLIQRKGEIAHSRTHLDVLFGDRSADVRIRIAGLDIDPGWVVWLGMVVQFHYDFKGYDDV